ncbi:MAG: hypothetical protein QM753_03880 [Thermomicrobiales bacterium]
MPAPVSPLAASGNAPAVIIFPIVCTIISLACAVVLARDARARPRPDKIVWALAFLMFALAAGADAAGRSLGWSEPLARLYYATGPALVVMYLAIGELYLLAPNAMRRFGVGATLLLTAFWVSLVVNAPIDGARLADDGWEAIERNGFMVAVTVAINAIGTLIIVGGTAYSAWRFWRKGIMRNRMIGCLMIALGTLAVAAGGSLTRLGHYEYLYIAMSIGVAIIFVGVLWTRRPEGVAASSPMRTSVASTPVASGVSLMPVAGASENDVASAAASIAPVSSDAATITTALGFVEGALLPLDEAGIDRTCVEWSVPRDARAVMERAEARAIWAFRSRLSPAGATRFDALGVPARRQIAELYATVLAPEGMIGEAFVSSVAGLSPAVTTSPNRPSAPVFMPDDEEDMHFPYA